MDDLDRNIKNLWKKLRSGVSKNKQGACPGEEFLARYADGSLSGVEKENMEHHLSQCRECLDTVLFYRKASESELHDTVDVPALWVRRTVDLVPKKGKERKMYFADIILKCTKDMIEVISNPGNLSIYQGGLPLPVRSDRASLPVEVIKISKTLIDVKAEVEIEKTTENLAKVTVIITKTGTHFPEDGLRITLSNPDKEIASHIAREGKAYFENLRYGEYVLKVTRPDCEIGQISFILQE